MCVSGRGAHVPLFFHITARFGCIRVDSAPGPAQLACDPCRSGRCQLPWDCMSHVRDIRVHRTSRSCIAARGCNQTTGCMAGTMVYSRYHGVWQVPCVGKGYWKLISCQPLRGFGASFFFSSRLIARSADQPADHSIHPSIHSYINR